MAYVPNSGSVVAFQGNPSVLQVLATVTNPSPVLNSVIAVVQGSVIAIPTGNQSVSGAVGVSSLLVMPGIVSTANSSTTPLSGAAAFTGTSEEVKDFGSIVVTVFADVASAANGLSLQQSSNGTNWDVTDAYTISASVGKTIQVQPAARFFRVVYTNGGGAQAAFRLQTIYHPQMVKPTSQRPNDDTTNESDTEQNMTFNMVYNGSNWDRLRGNSSVGALVTTGTGSIITTNVGSVISVFRSSSIIAVSTGSVISVPSGSVITVFQNPSIVGTYAEDTAHTTGDRGLMTLGVRNDAVASFVAANLEYTPHGVDSAGRAITKPFAPEESRVEGYNSVVSTSVTTLVAAGGAGLRNYITDIMIANTGSVATLITFRSQGGASVLGFTIAPAGGGSNMIGFLTPMRTGANETFDFQPTTACSILYATVKGFRAP